MNLWLIGLIAALGPTPLLLVLAGLLLGRGSGGRLRREEPEPEVPWARWPNLYPGGGHGYVGPGRVP